MISDFTTAAGSAASKHYANLLDQLDFLHDNEQ
jgi:hypothetical protein